MHMLAHMTSLARSALPALLLLCVPAQAQELTPDQSQLRAGPGSFASLASRLAPAVVNISTRQTVTFAGGGMPEFPPDSPLERFNEFFGGPGGSRVNSSLGSGFVIDPSGVIVTNNHVIEGADTVAINFVDGTSLDAEVVGVDPATDLAVLRVTSPEPLPYVEFGDSDSALVGDWVVAIGNPFGLGGTLTQGIISARNRQGITQGAYDDFIQTDAAINRGNSGGPLFAMDGHVIGVNTAILSTTGANVGIAFSVPSNVAAPIVAQILEFGVARRGWLGVSARDVSAQLAGEAGLDRARGAVLTGVTEDGPAAGGGLRVDDIVLTVAGREIGNSGDLQRIVAQMAVGDTIEVEYIRGGDRRTARITVAELESDTPQPRRQQAAGPQSLDVLGMTLAPLSNADRGRLGLAPDVRGVLVTAVDADTDAGGKIREGDVIEEIAWEPVATLDDAQARVDAALAQDVAQIQVVINRRGSLLVRSLQVD
jgi:serine protease Do